MLLLLVPALFVGCAAGPRIVATGSDTVVSVAQVADAIVAADVVAFGELHETPGVHRTHHALLEALHARRPNLVVAMEMFERDTQLPLLQYLNGLISEAQFRREARVWPHYDRDYRPVIEFCKRNKLHVIAANAPRKLASRAAREGLAAVDGGGLLARETTAPKDDYWDEFQEMMAGHGGMLGPGGMERFYASQCLKDDTMAESITDYLAERAAGNRPLVVFICGRAHSDHGWGTVQRIRSRMPDLDVRVLSAETVADVGAGVYETGSDVADFVVVADEPKREPRMQPAVAPTKPAATEVAAAADDESLPTENPPGARPAFGFMPGNYNEGVEGVEIGQITPGGCADKAGLEEGDYIVAVNGIPTPEIQSYVDVLDTLIIGRKATVRVRRAGAEVDLQVEVGSR